MVKNVEVKTQGIIARNEVQISRPGKKFLRKEQPRGTGGSCRSQASHHYQLWLSEAKKQKYFTGKNNNEWLPRICILNHEITWTL